MYSRFGYEFHYLRFSAQRHILPHPPQIISNLDHGRCTFTDRAGDLLSAALAHIACSENRGEAGFERTS